MARTARAARTVRTVRCARPARRIPIAFPVRIAGALRTARTVLTIGHTRTAHPIRIVSTYRTARTFGVTNGAALAAFGPENMSVTALRRLAHRHGLTLEKGHTRAELLVQVKAHIEKKLPEHLDVALGADFGPENMSVTTLRRVAYRHGLNLEKGHTRTELIVQVKEHIAQKQALVFPGERGGGGGV